MAFQAKFKAEQIFRIKNKLVNMVQRKHINNIKNLLFIFSSGLL